VEEIYREQRAFMFGVAYSRLRDRDDAEDAVQVASMTLMRQRSLPEDARAAAYTAVDYASRDLLRRRARENDRYSRLGIDAHDHPVPSAERAAMARIEVEETARTCPEAVLIGMGYRVNEVAQRMGITVRTVYNRLAREQCRC
jgi:DNA-directed RNA polymerase specialized sigma24 family protein